MMSDSSIVKDEQFVKYEPQISGGNNIFGGYFKLMLIVDIPVCIY